eukprot:scaffold963_cov88-Isochrysis_galbana.AAC.1
MWRGGFYCIKGSVELGLGSAAGMKGGQGARAADLCAERQHLRLGVGDERMEPRDCSEPSETVVGEAVRDEHVDDGGTRLGIQVEEAVGPIFGDSHIRYNLKWILGHRQAGLLAERPQEWPPTLSAKNRRSLGVP